MLVGGALARRVGPVGLVLRRRRLVRRVQGIEVVGVGQGDVLEIVLSREMLARGGDQRVEEDALGRIDPVGGAGMEDDRAVLPSVGRDASSPDL